MLVRNSPRDWPGDDWLRRAQITEHLATEWGGLSLVQAQMALLRAALEDAPDECAFGTMLNASGYPLEQRAAAQDITWSRWPETGAKHPALFPAADAALMGDIAGSGCFFARKFAAGSDPRKWGLHREG